MSSATTVGPLGIALIKHFESLHDGDLHIIGLQPKMCPAGVWTIGWGHAVVDPATKQLLRGNGARARAFALFPNLSVEQADALLAKDLATYTAQVLKLVKVPLLQHELDALVSFHYNTGALGRSKGLPKLNAGNKVGAWAHFSAWTRILSKGTGTVPGLVRRRTAEQVLFFHGTFTTNPATA